MAGAIEIGLGYLCGIAGLLIVLTSFDRGSWLRLAGGILLNVIGYLLVRDGRRRRGDSGADDHIADIADIGDLLDGD
jgi:hypothetical protein